MTANVISDEVIDGNADDKDEQQDKVGDYEDSGYALAGTDIGRLQLGPLKLFDLLLLLLGLTVQ